MKYSKNVLLLFLFLFIFSLSFVSAFSYSLSGISSPSSKPYQGDTADLTATITSASDNICTITCTWKTNNYGPSNIGNPEPLAPGQSKTFGFKVLVTGSGGLSLDTLVVTCQKYSGCMWGSPDSIPQQTISFGFNYNGDGTCTTSTCQSTSKSCEDCQSAVSDCPCSSGMKCLFDISRQKDLRGCTTYCGNGIKEISYETCSNCPADVGKCDGLACISGSECEGKYCVHEICWNSPYKPNDGFCDTINGENCKNSLSDCSCGINEQCSNGVCETYCGNNICETSEQGICNADCKWCGDRSCDASQKENCKTCESDCGVCENQVIDQEIQQKTQGVVDNGLKDISKKQKIITFSGIGAIVLVILFYLIFKILRNKTNSLTPERKDNKLKKKDVVKNKK